MKEYPIKGHRDQLYYVKHPIMRANGKWVCVDVVENGYVELPHLHEYDTETEAQKACTVHNNYHGWTTKEVYKIVWDSMNKSNESNE